MKKAAIIIGSVVAFIVILISFISFATSGMTDTASAFFKEVKAENYDKAYSFLSEDFMSNTSQVKFVEFLENSALLKFKETSWDSRSISGGQGELEGSVITETGGVVPIKIGFIKENEAWKIYSISKPKAGLVQAASSGTLPPVDELMELTDESMMKFAISVNAKDFNEFRSYASNLWKKQYTVDKFNEAFKPFMDAGVDMVPALKVHNPTFDIEPSINEDGILVLEGHYPTEPSRLFFKLSYVYEGISWKLMGANINIK